MQFNQQQLCQILFGNGLASLDSVLSLCSQAWRTSDKGKVELHPVVFRKDGEKRRRSRRLYLTGSLELSHVHTMPT